MGIRKCYAFFEINWLLHNILFPGLCRYCSKRRERKLQNIQQYRKVFAMGLATVMNTADKCIHMKNVRYEYGHNMKKKF